MNALHNILDRFECPEPTPTAGIHGVVKMEPLYCSEVPSPCAIPTEGYHSQGKLLSSIAVLGLHLIVQQAAQYTLLSGPLHFNAMTYKISVKIRETGSGMYPTSVVDKHVPLIELYSIR